MKKICGNCKHFKAEDLTCRAAVSKTVRTKTSRVACLLWEKRNRRPEPGSTVFEKNKPREEGLINETIK